MPPTIRVKEIEKDDNLGIIKKEIRIPGEDRIITPVKTFVGPPLSIKNYSEEKLSSLVINEISRRMDYNTIDTLDLTYRNILHKIKKRYVHYKLNIFIPHLRLPNKMNHKKIGFFSQFLHSVSDTCIVLPTVDSNFLKICTNEEKEYYILDRERIDNYSLMLKEIIENINKVGNGKPFIGMVPLIPVRYLNNLFSLYRDQGINSFLIDAGTKDILGASEAEYRDVLREINDQVSSLPKSMILASNLGYGLFQADQTIADDFLSLFAYVDIFNSTFKTRGFKKKKKKEKSIPYKPKAKIFSSENYVYNLSSYNDAGKILNIEKLNKTKLREYNEAVQLTETNKLQDLIGKENMVRYLLDKEPLFKNDIKIRRLRKVVEEVKL